MSAIPMKLFNVIASTAVVLLPAIAAEAQDANQQIRVKIKESKLEQQMTPDIKAGYVTEKRWRPKTWLEIDTEFDVDLARDLGGREGTYPALDFKYFVGTNQKNKEGKNIVLSGVISYQNIPASESSHVLAYITPAALKRALLKDNGGKQDVAAFGFEVSAGGQVIAVHSSRGTPWWIDANKQPDSTKFEFQDGTVLPKVKTPFAALWGDYDLEARQQ